MSTAMWKKYKGKRGQENKEREKDSYPRGGENCKMGSRWQRWLKKREGNWGRLQENWGNGSKKTSEVEESIWEGKVKECQ